MKQKLTALLLALVMAFSLAPATYAANDRSANLEANEAFLEDMNTLGVPYFITEQNEINYGYAQELAAEIIGNQTNATAYEKAKMLFTWMVRNCKYDNQKAIENEKTLMDAVGLGIYLYYETDNIYTNGYTGICGDFAKVYAELCWTQNIPCVLVVGTWNGGGHAWNLFYTDGEWHWADPTAASLDAFDMNINTMSSMYCAEYITYYQTASEWAEPWILQAMEYGLIDHEFSKDISWSANMYFDDPCDREGFAQLAVNLLEVYYGKDINTIIEEKGVTPGTFTDTDNPDVLAANALGIVTGNDGKYRPYNSITRQEAAAILYRTAKVMGYDAPGADLSVFTDLPDIGSWAHAGVAFCKATEIMGGITTTTFDPQGEYTAEQCLVTIVRLYEAATAQN